MTEHSAAQLDKQQIRAAFEKAADTYDEVAILQREVGQRLLERLDYLRMQPQRVLDVGAGTGFCSFALSQRYPGVTVTALDIAVNMLRHARATQNIWQRLRRRLSFVAADAEYLPLADASVDMIVSNLTLQWCENLQQVFGEFKRVLAPGGVLMFTSFGPDTLKELRDCWSQVDGYSHVNQFIDMHEVGDALMRAGFAEPVMDMEHITLTYQDAYRLMRDLKQLGAHNVTCQRPRGLTGKQRMQQVVAAYEIFRREGVLPATHEVVYGHAWVSESTVAQPGETKQVVHFDQLKTGR